MLTLTPSAPPRPPCPREETRTQSRPEARTHLAGLLRLCSSPPELRQFQALSIKSGLFPDSPAISSRLLALHLDPSLATPDQARTLFARIRNPTLLSYNALIKRLADSGRSLDALALFSALLRSPPAPPDSFTLSPALKACAQLRALPEGQQLHGFLLKSGLGLDPFALSSLVSLYAKCNEIGLAREVFDRIPQPDLVSWNALVDGYVKSGQIKLARSIFDEMPEKDAFSWTALINGYAKCGKIEVATELFHMMPEKSVVSSNAMIDGYMKCGQFELARELFEQVPVKNVITWNSMIGGFEKNGRFKEALEVYDAMFAASVAPSSVTLVSALSAVSGLAVLEKGRSIHAYIRRNGFSIDGVLGTSLIEMYSKCGSIDTALSVFEEIPRRKLGHWTAMIVGLGMHGRADHATELFNEMQRIGIKPHAITFVGVLNGCSHAGMVDEGRKYFKLMSEGFGMKPMMEHYGCLVDLLCRVGHLEEARDIIEQMPMKPNKVIWMSLLSGCRKYGKIEIGEIAAKNVIELDPEATGCYVLLSNMFAAAGLWENVSKLRETMKDRGIRKDPGCSMVEYGGNIHEFVVGDRSHPQTEQIYSKLNEMGERLSDAGYIPDTSQVLLCVEEKEKEVQLAHHSERLAIAFGLINLEPGVPIRIVKNLRVCNDCHNVTKLLSGIYHREIIVRDISRFHHCKDGLCSCLDYW